MNNKHELSNDIGQLKDYMTGRVSKGGHIDFWNEAREAAKTLFTQSAISKMDASGFIKQFKLYHSAN